ncbi:hypothetical protein EP331_12335 [bacterium]|nr:MAG: hypothetical protein EP331_12335 [bacterium]
MRFIAVFILILGLTQSVYAQNRGTLNERRDDAFTELDGSATLRFYDALNGNPISNASVTITGIGEFTTNFEGKITFPLPADGYHDILFQHPKYIPSEGKFEVMANSVYFNRFTVSPLMDIEFLRIVLEWDDKPKDLDANFVKIDDYHISYRNKRVSADGSASLDKDATNGEGPETITVRKTNHYDRYVFFVEDYSNKNNTSSKALAKSKATVRVYGNNRLMSSFQIEKSAGSGTKWFVFAIIEGQIQPINEMK